MTTTRSFGISGYSFAAWPASPPVFEAITGKSRLWIPVGRADRVREMTAPVGRRFESGALVAPPAEGESAGIAPAAGTSAEVLPAFLTNGAAVSTVGFDLLEEPDPVWAPCDDDTVLPRALSASPGQLIDWIERLRMGGIDARRHDSPDLQAQLHLALRRPVDTILCGAIDADPGACLNAALAAWYGIELAAGVALLARIAGAGRAMIAIDSRAPAAWSSSLKRCAGELVQVVPLVPDYPQSDPSLMVYTMVNRRLRPRRLPIEMGVLLLDAAAAIAIGRIVLGDLPMLSVPLVVRDHVLRQSFFVFAPVGTPARRVLEQARVSSACTVLRGGDVLRDRILPMDCIVGAGDLALHASAPQPSFVADPCVRCGWCVDACPTRVQPAAILEAAQRNNLLTAEEYGLHACIECGICSYVCPSRLPLLPSVQRMLKQAATQDSTEPVPA
jgi:electron transport complex protein RnfC